MKKLYHVELNLHVVVLADSGAQAMDVVSYQKEYGTFDDTDFDVKEIESFNDIPSGWGYSFPLIDEFGNVASKPVETIFKEQKLNDEINDDLDIITLNGKKYKRLE